MSVGKSLRFLLRSSSRCSVSSRAEESNAPSRIAQDVRVKALDVQLPPSPLLTRKRTHPHLFLTTVTDSSGSSVVSTSDSDTLQRNLSSKVPSTRHADVRVDMYCLAAALRALPSTFAGLFLWSAPPLPKQRLVSLGVSACVSPTSFASSHHLILNEHLHICV